MGMATISERVRTLSHHGHSRDAIAAILNVDAADVVELAEDPAAEVADPYAPQEVEPTPPAAWDYFLEGMIPELDTQDFPGEYAQVSHPEMPAMVYINRLGTSSMPAGYKAFVQILVRPDDDSPFQNIAEYIQRNASEDTAELTFPCISFLLPTGWAYKVHVDLVDGTDSVIDNAGEIQILGDVYEQYPTPPEE